MVHLKEEITKKRPQMKKKKVLVHQDNAPCHKLSAMMAKLHELQFELLLDPHNSTSWLVGWVLWHINLYRLFNAKFCLYVYTFNQRFLSEYFVGKISISRISFVCT